MRIKMLLKIEYQKLLVVKKALTSQLRYLPEGGLRIEFNGTYKKWYRTYSDKKEVYIKKSNRDLAMQLALKKHLSDNLAVIDQQLSFLEAIISKYPNYPVPLSHYKEEFQILLEPNYERNTLFMKKWLAAPFQANSEYPENLNIPTKAGVMVRSKSESIIANELFEHNVPFHYEQKLAIGETIIYPDFTIPGRNESDPPYIWEHFGLMDRPNYVVNAISKLKLYIDSGFIPGSNLIITFESKEAPLDIIYVNLLISHFFGDQFS